MTFLGSPARLLSRGDLSFLDLPYEFGRACNNCKNGNLLCTMKKLQCLVTLENPCRTEKGPHDIIVKQKVSPYGLGWTVYMVRAQRIFPASPIGLTDEFVYVRQLIGKYL